MKSQGKPEMIEPTALGAAIEKHWREHRPRMVKELEKAKQLEKAVLEAQELTGDLLYELVSVRKMDYQAAWELASREWAFLPEESRYQGSGTRSRKGTSGKRAPPSRKKKSSTSSPNRSSKRRSRRKTSE